MFPPWSHFGVAPRYASRRWSRFASWHSWPAWAQNKIPDAHPPESVVTEQFISEPRLLCPETSWNFWKIIFCWWKKKPWLLLSCKTRILRKRIVSKSDSATTRMLEITLQNAVVACGYTSRLAASVWAANHAKDEVSHFLHGLALLTETVKASIFLVGGLLLENVAQRSCRLVVIWKMSWTMSYVVASFPLIDSSGLLVLFCAVTQQSSFASTLRPFAILCLCRSLMRFSSQPRPTWEKTSVIRRGVGRDMVRNSLRRLGSMPWRRHRTICPWLL